MASSPKNSPVAFPSEVARYLLLEPKDVARLIKLGTLPAITLPKATRKVSRINLRDFYEWQLKRTENPPANLTDYKTFLADFNQSVRSKKTC